MKKNNNEIFIGIIGIIILLVGWFLYTTEFKKYTIVLIVLGIVILLADIIYMMNTKDDEALYSSTLKNILKNYESLLVRTKTIPELKGKNILLLSDIEELVNASRELKKPMYYYREEKSTSFFITEETEVLLYINKLTDDIVSETETRLKEIEEEEKNIIETVDSEILKDIEKTTIIRINGLEDYKAFKVSPIRKKTDMDEVDNMKSVDDFELPKPKKKNSEN